MFASFGLLCCSLLSQISDIEKYKVLSSSALLTYKVMVMLYAVLNCGDFEQFTDWTTFGGKRMQVLI